MMYLILAVLCVSGGFVAAQAPPSFCKGAVCPSYRLLSSSLQYEVRRYDPTRWATTSYTGSWNNNVLGLLFERLFKYINGANSQGMVMDMTVPVLTRIESAGSAGTKYTMNFLIPPSLSSITPVPTSNLITITDLPTTDYFVRRFGGYANGQIFMNELQNLVNDLNNPNTYNGTFFYTATYDSPKVLYNRHNEVWLQKY